MSNLSIFNFNQSPVKLLIQDETPFFNLIDICDVFGIQNPRRVLSEMLDSKGVRHTYTLAKDNKRRKLAFISEPNLYRIIFRSDKPIAIDFQNWVFDEVLPTIRKTGSYSLTINAEQQQLIQQAVNERAFRTGENHKSIYIKLHKEFKIPRYAELPASKFNDAIKFLGGVHVRNGLSDEDWYEIAWLYKVSYKMINEIIDIEPALRAIKSTKATTFWSLGHDNKPALFNAKRIIERETAHISDKGLNNKWNHVFPFIRHKPKGIINFEADIAYLD